LIKAGSVRWDGLVVGGLEKTGSGVPCFYLKGFARLDA